MSEHTPGPWVLKPASDAIRAARAAIAKARGND